MTKELEALYAQKRALQDRLDSVGRRIKANNRMPDLVETEIEGDRLSRELERLEAEMLVLDATIASKKASDNPVL